MKEKILIMGASGFIGRPLTNEFVKRGYEVTAFDINKPPVGEELQCPLVLGDLTNAEDVNKAVQGKDIVFNLAGLLGTHELVLNALNATKVNIIGALNVLEAVKNTGAKLIYTSKPNFWLNTYTITKIASQSFADMYHKEFNVPIVVVKPYNVYGAGQTIVEHRKALPYFIIQALKGVPVEVYGNGNQTGDFVYIGDTVKSMVLAAENESCIGKVVDIGSGEELIINKLAKLVIELTNSKSEIVHLPMRRGETENTRIKADTTLMKEIGVTQLKPLREGLSETIEHYKQKLEAKQIQI